MSKPTVDIIGELVSQLTFTEIIRDCSVNDGEITLTVCSTHGLVNKGIILIGGQPVKVKRVEEGTRIIIAGTSCPVETEIVIPAPNYFHGTIKAADSEISQIKSGGKKTPMVYLYEVLRERRNRNPAINLGRRVELVMFFLEDDVYDGDLTEDRYDKYIEPMTTLCEDFVDLLLKSEIIEDIEEEEYDIIPHAKAGFYDRVGHVKNLFSTQLSGVEFRISLPISKDGCIDCKQ